MTKRNTPKHSAILIFSLFILLNISSIGAHAQSGNGIKFDHVTTSDGLSNGKAYNILQDRQGFLWIATRYGLNKYDGYDATVYTNIHGNPHSLSSNFIWHLMEDDSGKIWVSTWGGGVNAYDPATDTFTRFQYDVGEPGSLSNDNVWSSYQDRQGSIWICTENGLNTLHPDDGSFMQYHYDPDNPDSISHNSATSIQEDRNGNLWVTTYGGGLNKFDRSSGKFVRYQHDPTNPNSLSNDNIWQSHLDRSGMLWLATDDGLNKFDPNTGMFRRYQHDHDDPSTISNNMITYITEDASGMLWVSTFGGGLNRFDPQTGQAVRYQEDATDVFSIRNNAVWGSVVDNTGILWVTCEDGVNSYDPGAHQFELYPYASHIPETQAYKGLHAFYIDEHHHLWVGSDTYGVAKFNRERSSYISYRHDEQDANSLLDNQVLSLQADETGMLWIGTLNGLSRFDPAAETFRHYQHDPNDATSLNGNRVFDIAIEDNGNIWLAIYGKGVDRYNPTTQKFTHYVPTDDSHDSVVTAWITTVEITSDGQVWAGGDGGLSRIEPGTGQFSNYGSGPGQLSSNSVLTTYEDQSGTLWVGTDSGLNRYETESDSFRAYFLEDGLPSNQILGILDDDQGNLWVSTSKGVSKFDPTSNTFRNYDAADGLQGDEFMARGAHKSPDGELFFGGKNGFNVIVPDRLHDNPHIPRVVLTDFQIFNTSVEIGGDSPLHTPINQTDAIILSYDQSVLSFKFAALSYRIPEKNRFAYMMEGFDDTWCLTGPNQRFATYTNLDPGQYTFRVKAANNDGVWNDEGLSLSVTITPPWWKTWWWYTLCTVGVLSVFGLAYWNKSSQLRKERAMSALLREREEKYRVLFESFPLGIEISDKTGCIVETNAIAETIFGIVKTDSRQHRIDDRAWKVVRTDGTPLPSNEYAGVKALTEQRKIENVEMGLVTPDGMTAWFSETAAPIPLEQYGVAITYHDITDRKQMEERLKASLKEKEILLRELYHRTKNTLQVIRSMLLLQASKAPENEQVQHLVHDTENRIMTIALVHEKLYQSQDLSRINISEYLQELTQLIFQNVQTISQNITRTFAIDEISVLLDTAIPCGLILNELLSNAMKYAFPDNQDGEIVIKLFRNDDGLLELHVEDNGVGVPPDFDFRHQDSLGLQTVVGIAEHQMQGTIRFTSGHGVTCVITFADTLYSERV